MSMAMEAAPPHDAGPGQNGLALAELGWRVLPIKPGEKRPPMSAWQHFASNEAEKITNWFKGLYRGHGIGVATGEASGVWVLDVDVGPDKEGAASLAELERRHGDLPTTIEAATGSGGRHLYFAWPEGRSPRTNRGQLGPGLDVRGEGGQVLAPPTIHPNGTPYAWVEGQSPWDIEAARAPEWLLDLVDPPPQPVVEGDGLAVSELRQDFAGESIADWYRRNYRWEDRLVRDGWTPLRAHGDQQYWVRPGKDAREGHSAVLHLPDGPFVIFSTDTKLARYFDADHAVKRGEGWAYSLFDYYAVTHHHGDRSAAAKRLVELRDGRERAGVMATGAAAEPVTTAESPFIDWHTFWTKEHEPAEWIVHEVLAKARGHALYAAAKQGKSLFMLWLAATLATSPEPYIVVYLDYEMSEADLRERLEDMGYGVHVDMARLRYALFPIIPPLDTPAGGQELSLLLDQVQHDWPTHHLVVIIDTYGRAVADEENSNDTTRNFYRWTGSDLKRREATWARLDHEGKDATLGQRGGSAKRDDVDVVWKLTQNDGGITLTRHVARMPWVPEKVTFAIGTDPLRYVGSAPVWPAGTKALAVLLEQLGVPSTASYADANEAIKAASDDGKGQRKALVLAAQRYRRELAEVALGSREPVPEPVYPQAPGTGPGTGDGNSDLQGTEPVPEPPEPPTPSEWVPGPVYTPEPVPGPAAGGSEDDPYSDKNLFGS